MDILVIRGTFDFSPDQPMTLSEVQSEIVWGDRFAGPAINYPLQAVIVEEGDLVLGKPGTDVLLQGSVRSAKGQWRTSWPVDVRVGPIRKTLRVYGPRALSKGLMGWSLGEPEKVENVPLHYRLAFGGCVYDPEPERGQAQIPNISYPKNPAVVAGYRIAASWTCLRRRYASASRRRSHNLSPCPHRKSKIRWIPTAIPHNVCSP